MKTIKLLLGILVLGMTSHLNAQVFSNDINVNIEGSSSTTLNGDAWSSTISPLDYAGTVWTDTTSPSGTNLAWSDSTLGNSGISYTFSAPNGAPLAHSLTTGSSLPLFAGMQYDQSSPMTMTFSGLDPTQTYDLVFAFYQQANGRGQTYALTVGSTPDSTTEVMADSGSQGTTFANGVNYVEFTNVSSDGTGHVTITDTTASDNTYTLLSGFQVAQVPVSTPEPTSVALIGLGVLALLVVSRRRTA